MRSVWLPGVHFAKSTRDRRVFGEGEVKDLAAVAGNFATVAGINVDKALLTGGRPKSNAQTHGTNLQLRR